MKMTDINPINDCKNNKTQNIIELKEEDNNHDYNNIFLLDRSDEEDIKSINELKYDIIQDSYKHMKNSLLILKNRLINNKGFSDPLSELEVRNLLNIKNYNKVKSSVLSHNLKRINKRLSKFNFEKIFYKIKVNYHKFIVSLANDIYNDSNSMPINNSFFRRISGHITHNSTKDFNKNLAELTLKDFISKSISSVYSNTKENVNRENIENIYNDKKKYKTLIDFLNCTYKDFYINFYIKDDCENLIKEKYKIKIKSYICFKEMIEKMAKKENKDYINEFIEVAKDRFIQFLEGKRLKHFVNN